jgi:hypothetical protein
MIQNVSFWRKILYLCGIALLWYPLYMIGRPAVGDPGKTAGARPGGVLAQLRRENDLSQAELGEIDPASESMRLATLGMRGVAANILWTKANEYKRTENWEALVATVNQMAKLQPNFVSVWEFQSHNLSYNVSVEQDDYRFRYQWVKKGIDFLVQGTRYNRREPKLFWTVGWYTGQKFGRADEHKQFRRLFREDREFHDFMSQYVDVDGEGQGPNGLPDNWLVSRLWFLRAYDLVDRQGANLRGKAPHIFFADGPKARMNQADAIESEGYHDEQAEIAWRRAGEEWHDYGNRLVSTSWGVNIRLNEEESLWAEGSRLQKELDALAPGIREQLRNQKVEKLTPDQRTALNLPKTDIKDEKTYRDRLEAETKVVVTDREVAEKAPAATRAKAFQIASQVKENLDNAERVNRYRGNVNFNYWRTRCDVEQKPETVTGRRHIYQAKQLQADGQLEKSLKEYNEAWDIWARILDQNPGLMESLMAEDLYEDVQGYVKLLGQLEQKLPDDFKLMKLLKLNEQKMQDLPPAPVQPPSPEAKPAEAKPAEAKPAEAKPAEAKPAEAKPAEAKPAEAKPAEAKPAEAKPAEAKPAEAAAKP